MEIETEPEPERTELEPCFSLKQTELNPNSSHGFGPEFGLYNFSTSRREAVIYLSRPSSYGRRYGTNLLIVLTSH